MEIQQLGYVLALARERNFSRAAGNLFITQPTLSQQLKKTEAELGFPLFVRSTRSVDLTERGAEFVRRAEGVVAAFDELQGWAFRTSQEKKARLSFGASPITMPHASACIPDFLARFPEVAFTCVEKWDPELLELVRAGELDVALIPLSRTMLDSGDLNRTPITRERVCAVVGPASPLAGRETVTLEELAGENIVSTSSQSGLTRLMKSEFALRGLNPHFTMNLISIEARLSMVEKGAVMFVMDRQFRFYQTDRYDVIPVEPPVYRTLALVTAKGRLNHGVRSFIDILRRGVAQRFASLTPPDGKE